VAVELVDGRRVRRHQNREAVIDAMVEMFHAGIYSPGSAQIAEPGCHRGHCSAISTTSTT